ncbi:MULTISPECIES: Gfo/Idh/MocA family oxidoreductase [unclassified Streptomyces]|uniref:Gfo/Idh/MocA family protein n=1 Tax=unclassified Streptomyces TaxID=2593676 RepID=UPI000F4EE7C5|nr:MULTISPECIES: Gfo/Idh/MocA family oxidoreductase [unclassified Streptomyces]MDH6450009.1 putative dehydrogenase [Streptomyces sp. SAI-119]MDH6499445.1 putative dehydrogenase [Streptomyces sp. SAI-149]
MNVLIVGMGYAGSRFLTAFRSLDQSFELAYHARNRTREDIPYFPTLEGALAEHAPDLVVVAATDSAHTDILTRLHGYRGFVLAEKPLTSPHDDLDAVVKALTGARGFALDLVERYSDATEALRSYVHEHELRLVRAHLTWGKDRINDHRPTVGVTSEVIHSLDLVRYVTGGDEHLEVRDALGVTSDFSVSGPEVLDSVALTATLGEAPVTVYSSFTNIVRQRTVDLAFRDRDGGLVYASCVYDTPVWDADHLRVWRREDGQEHTLCEVDTRDVQVPDAQRAVVKLRRLALDVVRHVADGTPPRVPFADLAESVATQRLLNDIETTARTTGPARYFPQGRTPVTEVDWERLG